MAFIINRGKKKGIFYIPSGGTVSPTPTPSFSSTKSLDFDGVDDKILFDSIALGTDYTISAWAKRDSTANMFLFGNEQTYGYGAYFNGTTNLYFKETISVLFNNAAIQTALTRTDWVNWVIKKDNGAGTMAVYVDGVLAESVTTGNGMSTITAIGASGKPTGTQYVWDGNIDEVSIFNTSSIDLADIGSTTEPKDLSAVSGLTHWFRMGENSTFSSPQILMPENTNKDKVSNFSMEFDGVNDYINCGTCSNIWDGTTDLTVSFWAKISSTGTFQFLIDSADNGATKVGFTIAMDSSRNFVYRVNEASGGSLYTTGYPYSEDIGFTYDNWHHVALVFDKTNSLYYFYRDGVQYAVTPTISSSTISAFSDLMIGRPSITSSLYADGKIDEVAIFNTALSAANITSIYNSGTPADLTSLSPVSWWRMGDKATFSTNWTVPDEIGSNDGTSANMTIEDRVGDASNSSNNSLSYNMDAADIDPDTPPN